jgi:hypothetical protein
LDHSRKRPTAKAAGRLRSRAEVVGYESFMA